MSTKEKLKWKLIEPPSLWKWECDEALVFLSGARDDGRLNLTVYKRDGVVKVLDGPIPRPEFLEWYGNSTEEWVKASIMVVIPALRGKL